MNFHSQPQPIVTLEEVRAILKSIQEFGEDRELTPEEAAALDDAASKPMSKIEVKSLPSRKK